MKLFNSQSKNSDERLAEFRDHLTTYHPSMEAGLALLTLSFVLLPFTGENVGGMSSLAVSLFFLGGILLTFVASMSIGIEVPLKTLRATFDRNALIWLLTFSLLIAIVALDVTYLNPRDNWTLLEMAAGRPDILILFSASSATVIVGFIILIFGGARYLFGQLKSGIRSITA